MDGALYVAAVRRADVAPVRGEAIVLDQAQ